MMQQQRSPYAPPQSPQMTKRVVSPQQSPSAFQGTFPRPPAVSASQDDIFSPPAAPVRAPSSEMFNQNPVVSLPSGQFKQPFQNTVFSTASAPLQHTNGQNVNQQLHDLLQRQQQFKKIDSSSNIIDSNIMQQSVWGQGELIFDFLEQFDSVV